MIFMQSILYCDRKSAVFRVSYKSAKPYSTLQKKLIPIDGTHFITASLLDGFNLFPFK